MKFLERFTLIVYSFVILLLSVILSLLIFNWIDFDVVTEMVKALITGDLSSKITLGVSVVFILLSIKCIFFDENSKENLSSENKVEENAVAQTKFEEGKYIMTKPSSVGTEAEGYDTTITFKDGKVSYLESYWGTKKNGTYSVQGDTLIIKYTSGNDVDSIEGDKGTIALNITEEYKIDGKEIIVQKASDNPYTTAGSIVYELSK